MPASREAAREALYRDGSEGLASHRSGMNSGAGTPASGSRSPASGPPLPSRPAGFAATRFGVSLSRCMSNPEGVTSACGLPASSLLTSVSHKTQPVDRCIDKRRDHTLGYRGFIPGLKAETVYAASKSHAAVISHGIRPRAGPDDGVGLHHKPGEEYTWHCAPDYPSRKRMVRDCSNPNVSCIQEWANQEQGCPPLTNGGSQPRHYGEGIQGFSGHHSLRLGQPRMMNMTTDTLAFSNRLSLAHTMSVHPDDRDCQPFDAHRASIPGYSGHIKGRHVATDERHLLGRSGF